MSHRAVDGLIERLYGMPQVGADWRPFLTAVGDAFRAHVMAFHSHDVLHHEGVIDTAVGLVDGVASRFKALAHEHPWYIHGGEKLFREGMADDEGLIPTHELYGTRFYGEVLEPARVEHGMALVLRHDGPTQMTLLTINRHPREGFYRPDERRLARELLPHLRAAYLLQQRLGWAETLARSFRHALDRLDDGIVILDRRGVIRFANTMAERYESSCVFHRSTDGRLRLPTVNQSHVLQRYLQSSMSDPQPLSLRIQDPQAHWIASLHACPVDHVAGWQWGEPEAGVMLFFSAARAQVLSNHREHWRELWAFTRAEADLAQRLAEGRSLSESAELAGVSINTVRTQLRGLLGKTGARRQSDLVRMLLLARC